MLSSIAKTRLQEIESEKEIEPPDFPTFCQMVRIVPKSGPRVPLNFNPIQSIFNIERTGRDIILKPRQIGFTTLEVARDVWHLLCKEGARVVVVCQSTSDNAPAKLISGVIRIMLESLRAGGWAMKFVSEAWNEWVLDNGNSLRIVVAGASEASASKKGRAGTITRLHLTETAFYEHADTSLNALLECVPGPETGSEIVNESTANGAAGLFYRYCKSAQSGKSSNKFHFYPWYQHPDYQTELDDGEQIVPNNEDEENLLKEGVTPEQLKWRRQKIEDKGKAAFDQEYPADPESCFLLSGRGFFEAEKTAELLQAAEEIEPVEVRKQKRIRIYLPSEPKKEYVLALDTAEGTGGDGAAGVMYERSTGAHVATIDGQFTPYQLAETGAALGHEYNEALIAVERNNHGHAVIQALQNPPRDKSNGDDILYDNLYVHDDDKVGFLTDQVTRPQILDDLEDSHRRGLWTSPDHALITQMRTFVILKGKPQAAPGENDDLVMAAAIGWCVRQGVTCRFTRAMQAVADRDGKIFQ